MECTVRWMGNDAGMAFVAETGSGHAVVMDGAPEAGGRNIGLRPMEMVLAGTGGCSAFDVVLILKKGRHQVSSCDVSLQADRAETDPKVFTRIAAEYPSLFSHWPMNTWAVEVILKKATAATNSLEVTLTVCMRKKP